MTAVEAPEEAPKPEKKATRPGSQWATGRRRTAGRKAERQGFARGAKTK